MSRDITPYEVLIDERVEKDLEKIPNYIVEKFLKLLDEFEKNPIRPRSGFDVKHLEGYVNYSGLEALSSLLIKLSKNIKIIFQKNLFFN